MFKLKHILLISLLTVLPFLASAQLEKVAAAINSLQNNQLDSAKIYIDAAVLHPETKNISNTWRVKAQVYKTIYSQNEKSNKLSPSRAIAIDALIMAIELEKDSTLVKELKRVAAFFASTHYNDAAKSIDSLDFKKAIINFENFQKCLVVYDTSSKSMNKYKVEFLLALETVYSKLYNMDKKANQKYFDLAIKSLEDVLEVDSENFSANKNLALLYHNKTVGDIKELEYDTDIVQLNRIQDKHQIEFLKSLKYAIKAHELNSGDITVLRMLTAIYSGLYDYKKAIEYALVLYEIDPKDKANIESLILNYENLNDIKNVELFEEKLKALEK